jgi:GNAT superfamily N-acetyltransferase
LTAIVVRARQDRDIPALADVLLRVHAHDGYPVEGVHAPARWLAPTGLRVAWTAVLAGRPVGHVAVVSPTDTDGVTMVWQREYGHDVARLAIAVRLFVDPSYRHRGAGQLLMAATAEYAALNSYSLAFDVMAKDKHAIRLYERAGCQRIGEILHEHSAGEREPAYVYVAPPR